MTYSPKDSLPLCQVLEEEYMNLADNGELNEEEKEEEITLHGKRVVARLDWRFHRGHITDPDVLIRKLEDDHDLCSHLKSISHDLEDTIKEYRNTYKNQDPEDTKTVDLDDAKTKALRDMLNRLLELPIYNEGAFKHSNLKDVTRNAIKPNMIAPAANRPQPPAESADDLAHMNRIILEETFPKALEKIYEIRLAAMYKRLHRKKMTALSLSGGGIRSGTFALGLIQRLARFGLLDKFDYLSTVSGGGYIGSWLTAWQHRHPKGLSGVMKDLDNIPVRSKIDPDPRSIQHLREYSNFLTPKAGLLTADTWTFVAIYLRNLLLNWLVLIPLLIAVLAIPRLFVALQLAQPAIRIWSVLGQQLHVRHILLVIGAALLTLAIMYVCLNRPGISQQLIERSPFWRKQKRMRQEGFLKWCLLPTFSSAVLLTVYLAWSLNSQAVTQAAQRSKWITYIISGAAIPIVAYVGCFLVLRRWKPIHWNEINRRELKGALVMSFVGAVGGFLAFVASQANGLDPTVQNVDLFWRTEIYTCVAVPLLLLLLLLVLTLFIGLTSGENSGIEDEDREWWARCNGWFLIAILAWVSLNTVVIFGPLALFAFPKIIASVGGGSAIIALFAGKSSKTPANAEQASQKGMMSAIISEKILPLLAVLFLIIFFITLSLGTTVVLGIFAKYPISKFFAFGEHADKIGNMFDGTNHMRVIHYSRSLFDLAFIVISGVIGFGMGWAINLNKFSLHAGYRNRLIRAFLGASRDPRTRNPNPFTGFDPQDNIHMHELRAALLHENDFEDLDALAVRINSDQDKLSTFLKGHLSVETQKWLSNYTATTPLELGNRVELIEDLNRILEDEGIAAIDGQLEEIKVPSVLQTTEDVIRKRLALTNYYSDCLAAKFPPPQRLLHVVNMTLNLVGGKNLAWQQRKAETFTSTPLHSGCYRIGYRKSRFYGGPDGISLGTAAATSGAAASSNMGYYTSSPVLSMVLTLFNVRLGWWLGNPGPAGDTTFDRSSPKLSITPVIAEAFGLTDDQSKYVYLTDGGHFENLGVYEMVLRRCHIIVVSDAAADGDYEFGDLGNAIRKIRIDLGVPIEFDEIPIHKYEGVCEGKTGGYWAFARIGYSDVDGPDVEDGVLLYIKPAVYGNEPRDVVQYRATHETFPHQSTADQFFDEPQFESYRALGAYVMEQMCEDRTGGNQPATFNNLGQFIARAYKNYRVLDVPLGRLSEIDWLVKWLKRRRV